MARPTEQFRADLNLWTNRHNGVRKEPRRAIVIHTDESAYNYATGTGDAWAPATPEHPDESLTAAREAEENESHPLS